MDLTSKFLEKSYEYNIKSHGVRLPTFDVSTEDKKANGAESDISNIDFLKLLSQNGFHNLEKDGKIDPAKKEDYLNRVKYEMSVVEELGFTDYFLMVWDVINFCRKNEIPTGRGRGSCAGSLVLYLIGVTKIDPIRYGLIFERFISKVRAKKQIIDGITYLDGSLMCDVDMDICYYNRHRVLEYLDERYKGKTCKIGTVSTLSGKLLIKEVGKIVGGKSETEMNLVSKMIPTIFGQVKDIESLYNEDGENNEFRDWCNKNKRVYEIALKLRDLIKNKGVHASGVAISHGFIQDAVPLELTKDKEIVSGYDMEQISQITVKLDCLGLKSVSVVDQCCKLIGIKEDSIDVENPFIYRCYQEDIKLHGLFQIEADLAGKALKKIKPRNLDELSAVLALARPGAMQFIDDFAKFTASGTYKGVHPFFDVILKDTAALCLFQEQLLQMIVAIGFTLEDAETVRRIVGKKKVEEMKLWEEKIKAKIQERNLDPKIGEVLWKIADDSSKYSFNKCLSPDTIVEVEGERYTELFNIKIGDKVKSYDVKRNIDKYVEVVDVISSNQDLYEIELEDGRKIKSSLNHKFLCSDFVMRELKEIIESDLSIVTD